MNKNIFEVMVEMQHEFNKKVAVDYLEKNFNWNSAIIAESGELLESLGYKWWKKQEPDMENVKVEAIDLLHFVISEEIQSSFNHFSKIEEIDEKHIILATTQNCMNYFHSCPSDDVEDLNRLVDLLNYHKYRRIYIMKNIFDKLNMSNEDVYIAYITKNCLNKFRQDNGYKDGTYIKDWNGKEDNVVAFEIANEWGADEELFEQLYKDLETYYNEEVLKDKKELHLSNILDDISYIKAVDTEVGE
ncbi:dUTP diphosphatase [Aliarcobacter butzleri]|uniref:dUTP diphosphatase n=1 Tax=Aliarcobacter butzleri TaxID=28197 RepID=UPI002B253E36|nr:dUTP diphosphatase [Aliarcobacter butzleri]